MKKVYLLCLGMLFLLSCSKDDEASPDFVPTITITATSAVEGSAVTLLVVLDSASLKPVTFEYVTENKTATAGEDYIGANKSVTINIPPGERNAMINLATLNDGEVEDDETFTVKLSNPVNGKLAQEEIIITLKNKSVDKPEDPGRMRMSIIWL